MVTRSTGISNYWQVTDWEIGREHHYFLCMAYLLIIKWHLLAVVTDEEQFCFQGMPYLLINRWRLLTHMTALVTRLNLCSDRGEKNSCFGAHGLYSLIHKWHLLRQDSCSDTAHNYWQMTDSVTGQEHSGFLFMAYWLIIKWHLLAVVTRLITGM